MAKESFYFSHDYGSRNDPKLMKVLMKLGQEGKGVYWDLIEMLYEQGGYLMLSDCDSYAFALRTSEECITSLINDFGLFENDGEKFWSNSVMTRLNKREAKSQKAKESAFKRWNKTDSNANASNNNANALQTKSAPNAIKESKVKESKVKEIVEEEDKEENLVTDTDYPSDDAIIPKPNAWGAYSSMDDLEKVLLSHSAWQADFGKSLGIESTNDVPKWIKKFFSFCNGSGKIHEKESDAKSHCHSWTRRQIELGKTLDTSNLAIPQETMNGDKPSIPGTKSGELIGKWIWLNNGWRNTTTFTDHQKRRNGLV
ncbi:DUF4373 domain-containing protein [Sphingobacterium sp. UT-1RO-CII-1]|uniref:DUF4373 domain-containing protein n=1 Tax=Sphingobacterium sp. UT-1RO-CII-1 TaxID=2995225 RepID=UPI00227A5AB4|nr:DUF4373 domain-containing protein [Sphingobacterium sp. UT-1RO-CII-1]MCY4781427.1 DUF4373 domain-containing protein [Sphingobacterium sp. UT-1RO-CII-1]